MFVLYPLCKVEAGSLAVDRQRENIRERERCARTVTPLYVWSRLRVLVARGLSGRLKLARGACLVASYVRPCFLPLRRTVTRIHTVSGRGYANGARYAGTLITHLAGATIFQVFIKVHTFA
jgi:hypothetical protein